MASSRRTSPVQISRQQKWPQEPSEEAISTSNIRVQNNEESERRGKKKRTIRDNIKTFKRG